MCGGNLGGPVRRPKDMSRLRLFLVLLLAGTACGTEAERPASSGVEVPAELTDRDRSRPSATSGTRRGASAVWFLAEDEALSSSADSVRVLVSRLGCNSGITGTVYEPEVDFRTAEVVVTFSVEATDGGDCQRNDLVPYTVELGEPVGSRRLVDGACTEGEEAAGTYACTGESDPVRWRP